MTKQLELCCVKKSRLLFDYFLFLQSIIKFLLNFIIKLRI